MTQTQEHEPTTSLGRPSSRALWFGLLSGPIIWSVQFLIVYLLVEIACQAGVLQTQVLGLELVSLLVIILTAASLASVAYGGLFSYRKFQQTGDGKVFDRENLSASPARFMALSGLALNLLFGLLILLMGIPAIVLAPCVR